MLKKSVYDMLTAHKVPQRRKPGLDEYASTTTTKVPDSFFSKFLCPSLLGVYAWHQNWVRYASEKSKQLVYINDALDQMKARLSRVKNDRVDCIFVDPQWPRHWQALMTENHFHKTARDA